VLAFALRRRGSLAGDRAAQRDAAALDADLELLAGRARNVEDDDIRDVALRNVHRRRAGLDAGFGAAEESIERLVEEAIECGSEGRNDAGARGRRRGAWQRDTRARCTGR
jgi:hypothetical protein